jgi:hypothetical protein
MPIAVLGESKLHSRKDDGARCLNRLVFFLPKRQIIWLSNLSILSVLHEGISNLVRTTRFWNIHSSGMLKIETLSQKDK